ncbi:hypothetical protein J3R82DRAFT_3240 [Butyriboletus roseoflavus]|nr:hypothetical protein J3R82DRAFT_3240 [Butyriboletus roseoflavus]
MSTCKTHPSNVNKHLGLLDLPQKRWTAAEKKADDELLANTWAKREASASQALQQVSELEEKMKNEQTVTKASVTEAYSPSCKEQ